MQKNSIIVAVVLVVLVGGFYIFNSDRLNEKEVDEAPIVDVIVPTAPYVSETYGFQFNYPVGADGYLLAEPIVASPAEGAAKTILLVHADDVELYTNPPIGGEGPPAISIYVFNNINKQRPQAWAEAQLAYSNLGLALSEIEETTVDGALAIRYRADGLYPSNTTVITNGSWVYVVSGSYRDETAPTYRDYDTLLSSITFTTELGQE